MEFISDEEIRNIQNAFHYKKIDFLKEEKMDALTIDLNEKQKEAFDAVLAGESVFITGKAGTGKSFLLKKIIEAFNKLKKPIHVTATTGCAAVNINGSTLHKWAAIGLGQAEKEKLLSSAKRFGQIAETKTLIIEEISMLTLALFEKLNWICQQIKCNELPFGGIQVIFVGDFLQLPCIDGEFCFLSEVWTASVKKNFILTENFRQADDELFQQLLKDIRIGNISNEIHETLKNRISEKEITTLFSRKVQVEKYNEKFLNELKGEEVIYRSIKTGEKDIIDMLFKNANIADTLKLKVDALVVLTRNIDTKNGLVNGSQGKVIGFENGLPIVEFKNGRIISVPHQIWSREESKVFNGRKSKKTADIKQIPLILAWGLTIHKCQGMTLDEVCIDLSDCFEFGQAYVALSRCKKMENLYIKGYKKESIKTNPIAIKFYETLKSN